MSGDMSVRLGFGVLKVSVLGVGVSNWVTMCVSAMGQTRVYE